MVNNQIQSCLDQLCDTVRLNTTSIGDALQSKEAEHRTDGRRIAPTRQPDGGMVFARFRQIGADIVQDVQQWLEGPFLSSAWSDSGGVAGLLFDQCEQLAKNKLDTALQVWQLNGSHLHVS